MILQNQQLQTKVLIHNLDLKYTHSNINQIYFIKYIQYGNFIDVTNYKKLRLSFKNPNQSFVRQNRPRTSRSLQRTRETIYRLVQANTDYFSQYRPIFATFKFARNITDIREAYNKFKLFRQRFAHYLALNHYPPFRYVGVPEFQQRGAVHFHLVVFNSPFIPVKTIEKIWSYGEHNQGIDWQIAEKIGSCSCYLLKYITKDLLDSRLQGQRILLSSRNLVRPVQSFDAIQLDSLMSSCDYNITSYYEESYIKKITYKKL